MPLITFLPSGSSVQAEAGAELIAVALQAGFRIESECGGKGTCSSCLVLVTQGTLEGESTKYLSREALEEGYVLACMTRVGTQDATIQLNEHAQHTTQGQFSKIEEDLPTLTELAPLATFTQVRVPLPQALDGLSDADRLTRVLETPVHIPVPVLRKLAATLRAQEGNISLVYVQEHDHARLVDIWPQNNIPATILGAAVDIGTTSVALSLVDLITGHVLSTRTDYNEQITRGQDVISRINYAQRAGGLRELRQCVRRTINKLLREATRLAGASPKDVMAASLAGNTVMTHLLLGLDPEYIRLAPYTPTVHALPHYTATELGLALHAQAPISLAPCVGSYVGGDITTGLLCADVHKNEEMSLFIDIGTNGEIVLGNQDFLMCCACSAGPAFEGAGLSCGMRAATGAIERVLVDKQTGACTYDVINNAPPAGICGSGVISLLAQLFLTGWLDAAGKFNREHPSPAIQIKGRKATYVIAAASEHNQEILLTETDVDNVLRAKAAIYSGCALLLEQAGIEFTDLARVVIAGGFGHWLDVDNAVTLGLLPDIPRERFNFVGNASRLGACLTLLSQKYRKLRASLAEQMTYMDLSNDAAYMDHYTAALFLPHTDAMRFPSVHVEKRNGHA